MSWQKILAQGFTSSSHLLDYLELPFDQASLLAEKQFSSRVPLSFAKRMQKKNPKDPLLLQVLAHDEELTEEDGYVIDPLLEKTMIPVNGLIHKYHGRVLLTLTGVCAVNCRFCFRRHFPYQDNNPGRKGLLDISHYIAKDNTIHEVILSGGDPLLASDSVLAELIQLLENIPHVRTLRIHTRIPIVFPERIDNGFISVFEKTSLNLVMVLHSNHPQELNDEVGQVCHELREVGFHLLNQAVLLAGINDSVAVLEELSHRLFAYRIMPYYLHLLDKVKGAGHFDLPLSKAQELYYALQRRLPGYLLPRLAREEPGEASKTLVC